MNKLDILNALNMYAINRDEKPIITLINLLIQQGLINEFKELFFKFISVTQFYGYIEYLSEEQKKDFLNFDLYTSSSYKGHKIGYYNRGQLSLLNEMEENKKIFVSAPTSFGKTSLIMELILENRALFNNVLMILPTNSLIEELFFKFNEVNYEYELEYQISTQPMFLKNKKNMLILTPERFLILAEETNIECFGMIVMDETYKIVDFNNPTISDFINRRSFRFRKVADMLGQSQSKVLYLSPYTYKMKESMSDFLDKYSIKNVVRKIDYVSHQVVRVVNSADFAKLSSIKGYEKKSSINKKTNLILETLKNEKSIVYVGNYYSAYKIVDTLSNEFRCLNERYVIFLAHMKENYSIEGTPVWKVIEGLEKGIGIYISPLPRYVKKEIVKLYEVGILKTLVVTTAFTEGINTDAEHLIITTLVSGPSKNKLTELDLLNTVGRAGRFAKVSVGKIYCITEDIYNKVKEVKSKEAIALSNDNYIKGQNILRNDYEIEMINDNYLNKNEIERKKHTNMKMYELNLTNKDLDISLNVSKVWKLQLYEKFKTLEVKDIEEIMFYVDSLVSDEGKRLKSTEFIFNFIRETISVIENPFPQEPYEIRPFDRKGGFIWGRMYRLYSSYTTKVMIYKNMEYIIKLIDTLRKEIGHEVPYKVFKKIVEQRDEGWIVKYIKDGFSLNYDKFYTEAFKFISSIIQFKIPYYISFFVSIFKLYLTHNNLYTNFAEEINLNDIVLIFENNNTKDEYSKLINFGISNDILKKLSENQIKLNDLNNVEGFDFLDNYEKLMISDIVKYL